MRWPPVLGSEAAGLKMRRKRVVTKRRRRDRRTVGWREWVTLPSLGIRTIKAKLDTGARTSALHAWDVTAYHEDGEAWVRFTAHPRQRDDTLEVNCTARLLDRRWVTTSGGKREKRYVIGAMLGVDNEAWPIELTLTNRDEMGFRLLIGREAMRGRLIVDPISSYVTGTSHVARGEARTGVIRRPRRKPKRNDG